MNDKDSVSEVAPQQGCRWYRRKRYWMLGVLAAFVIWLFVPSTYSDGRIRFSVHHAGESGVLTFIVRDLQGRPLQGVTVMSESLSGTTGEFTTDATGVATIRPGESEVLAVYIQEKVFRFQSPESKFPELFAPSCSPFGLIFRVSIRSE